MIRLGIVGLRNIGKVHVKAAKKLEGVKFVAGVDTDEARSVAAKEEFGFEYVTKDAAKVFNDPNIDGVVLALPNHLHAPMSIAALEAGKHVLVEKPISNRSHEVRSMMDARDKAERILMVGMNQRFSAKQYAIREAIRSKALGEIYLSKSFWNRRYPFEGLFERGTWGFNKKNSGGGPLLDLGIHKLDLILFLMDFPEIESVTGFTTTGIGSVECAKRGVNYDVEDFAMGVIRLKNGSCIHLESSYFHNQPEMENQDFFLSGTKGLVRDNSVFTIEAGEEVPFKCDPLETAPKSCLEHFCRVIRNEEALSSTCEQALTGLKIIEAIYESSETGKPIYL